eukprot:CAMPEP_0196660044 /NCGR_PEP_ID=MMETSP1086-20130531/37888_1 /TAXON_ID=77921 /ORGANISM="Cyanoptyche  gloeocystis , Strain SAG4.97" /LENGTH=92 /DNA_ID=CAMNT_0041994279 /DNA_START=47 /DNA_END=322 /DNA_ORIENTATION=+
MGSRFMAQLERIRAQLMLPRLKRFAPPHCAASAAKNVTGFTVMQWNSLAQGYCNPEAFPASPPQCLEWQTWRKWKILEEILTQEPDILCMQE